MGTSTNRTTSKVNFELQDNLEANVEGYVNPHKLYRCWTFTDKAINATNDVTVQLDTTSTIAVGAGGLILTTAATDNKVATISFGGLYLRPLNNPVVEFRFQTDVVTTLATFAGLNDSADEGAATMPFALSGTTLTDTATDGAGFLFDVDQDNETWNIVNTNGNTEAFTQLAATYIPVAATPVTLRVHVNPSGDALYYYNGALVGTKLLAVATTALLIPFFGIKNMDAAAHICTLRRVSLWLDQ
jgi:hypothetical protein